MAPTTLKVLTEAGVLTPVRPDRLARMLATYVRWGNNPATASALAAIRHPDDVFVDDELGTLTFAEVDGRANALARALAERGIEEGDGVAIMARNHRGLVDATLASAKLGCSALFLNTMFSGPQLADVMEREGPTALIYDQEFTELLGEVGKDVKRFVCWHDDEPAGRRAHRRPDRGGAATSRVPSPSEDPRFVILTSGTTGTPKGAQRKPPSGLSPIAALLGAIPYHAGETMMIAAPLFHSWGFTHFVISTVLGNRMVLRRKFDPGGDAEGGRGERRPGARRRAGDAAAHPPARRRGARQVLAAEPADHRGQRLGAARRAGDRVDGPLRRQHLQPLRLDRGRLRDDRLARGPARGARHGRPAPARHRDPDRRRGGQRRRAGRDRAASSSATRWPSRATPAVAARRRSATCSPPATSATSTRTDGCSSTAATTR